MTSRKLKDELITTLSDSELKRLVRGYDVIGDVAILIIPEELHHFEKVIGEAVLRAVPAVRVVARRDGYYTGEFRTIRLRKIAGNGGLETRHREFGVTLHVNPELVYFSPRSGTERYRIATKTLTGERVLVMFSGIGPLPLMIGKHGKALEIIGVEMNQQAHFYGVKNLKANRKITNVRLLPGDVWEAVPKLAKKFDRIAMVLPDSAEQYLQIALNALNNNGWLHFYTFQNEDNFQSSVKELDEICNGVGRNIIESAIFKCGHISPGKYRVCIDAKIL